MLSNQDNNIDNLQKKYDKENYIIDYNIKKRLEKYGLQCNSSKDISFIALYGHICTDEQLFRILNSLKEKELIVKLSKYKIIYNAIIYILKHDENWIISIDRLLKRIHLYMDLVKDIENLSENKFDDDTIQLFLSIISDDYNYFEVFSFEDMLNYYNKKNKICLDIMNRKPAKISQIEYYTESLLYKFALLEYIFGISLNDAKDLINRYGYDANELPQGYLRDYLQILKDIINCDNIKDITGFAIKKQFLKEPWQGFPEAREAEGKILNLFSEIYNQTLYKPIQEDKEDYSEIYIDSNGNKYDIEIYKVKKDFRINARVEGALNEIS